MADANPAGEIPENYYTDSIISIRDFIAMCLRFGINNKESVNAIIQALKTNHPEFENIRSRRLRVTGQPRLTYKYSVLFEFENVEYTNGVGDDDDEFFFALSDFIEQFDGGVVPRLRRR